METSHQTTTKKMGKKIWGIIGVLQVERKAVGEIEKEGFGFQIEILGRRMVPVEQKCKSCPFSTQHPCGQAH